MFKNLLIFTLTAVLSFSAGVVSTKYCPVVKRFLGNENKVSFEEKVTQKKSCCDTKQPEGTTLPK